MGYGAIVVGSGLSGSTAARILAESGKRVLVLERRGHIAGNVYDEIDDGILVQRYGPHLFYTDMADVYGFLSRFTEFEPYVLRAATCIDGKNLPMPFNFASIDFFYSESEAQRLKEKLSAQYPAGQAFVLDLLRHDDTDIRAYGELLFAKDYRLYSAKQWGMPPEDIDPAILRRMPVFLSYRDTRFDAEYQCLPQGGFTAMVANMLAHPNIDVQVGVEANDVLEIDFPRRLVMYNGAPFPGQVVYTGSLDELAGFMYGRLPYRSLEITYDKYPVTSYLDYAAIAYPEAEGYVRKTEYTKLPWQEVPGRTIVGTEYPVAYEPESAEAIGPAYPILTAKTKQLYTRYLDLFTGIGNLLVCGRLGDYRYYDMDQAVKRVFVLLAGE